MYKINEDNVAAQKDLFWNNSMMKKEKSLNQER